MLNNNFNEWYIDISIMPQEGQIDKRLECIHNYANEINAEDIVTLVRLYYGLSVENDKKEEFASIFSQKDPTFSVRYTEELALLAGAVLVEIAENNFKLDSLAELLSLTTSFYRKPVSTDRVLNAIVAQFDDDRIDIREGRLLKQPKIFDKNLLANIEPIISNSTWDSTAGPKLISVLNEFSQCISSLRTELINLQNIQSIYKEDSQLLWWIMSDWSNLLNCSLKQLDKSTCCLVLGYEAAKLISNYPGPYAMEGIIERLVGSCRGKTQSLELHELISKTDEKFKSLIIAEAKHVSLLEQLPIIKAIICADNTNDTSEWYPKYCRELSIDEHDTKKTFSKYAWQMYLEYMALSCYKMLTE